MSRFIVRSAAACAALLAAAPAAAADRQISPYIELDQVLVDDLQSGDVLTYSEIAAGIDASISTRRAEGQISYRYERRIGEGDHLGDDDVHTGLARGSVQVTRDLTIEGGGIATRARSDIRGAAPGIFAGNVDNVTQIYSLYAGPTLTTRAGPVELGASYRYAYTKAEAPNGTGLAPGAARRDYFDHSDAHVAQVSAGLAPGAVLPIGLTASAAYDRENASQLKQRYVGKYARVDALAPVSRTVALTAGVGYEKITVSEKDPLLAADGTPVVDGNGRFVTDPNSPRRLDYNTDGLIYDAGVVWRPSPRSSLTATVAHRYGGTSYTGALAWQPRRDLSVQAVVYDGIETFGRQLREGLQSLPTSFLTQRDSFGQQFNGCVFGAQPGVQGQGAGGCLNGVFQSIATASYRARGIDAVAVLTRGANSFGVGGGYANRHLHSPDTVPGITVIGLDDESYYAQAFWSHEINRVSGVDVNLFANWYDTDLPGSDGVFGGGATGSYYHNFGRLGTIAQLGVYTFSQDARDNDWSAQALLGARYQF